MQDLKAVIGSFLSGAVVVALVFLVLFFPGCDSERKKLNELYRISNEAVKQQKLKNGKMAQKVETLQGTIKEIQSLHTSETDSLTRELQKALKEVPGKVKFVAVVHSVTTGVLTGKPDTVKRTTPAPGNVATLDPEPITGNVSDGFLSLNYYVTPDSVSMPYKYETKLKIWNTYETPLFKRNSINTYYQDENPNAQAVAIKSYTEPAPRQYKGFWYAAGAASVIAIREGIKQLQKK